MSHPYFSRLFEEILGIDFRRLWLFLRFNSAKKKTRGWKSNGHGTETKLNNLYWVSEMESVWLSDQDHCLAILNKEKNNVCQANEWMNIIRNTCCFLVLFLDRCRNPRQKKRSNAGAKGRKTIQFFFYYIKRSKRWYFFGSSCGQEFLWGCKLCLFFHTSGIRMTEPLQSWKSW